MDKNIDELIDDKIINDNVEQFLIFFNNILNEYNVKFVKRFRKIDFYDLFFYMLHYNSSVNETHSSCNLNFHINYGIDVSENAYINRLIKLDPKYIKDINDRFINFYYTLFKIDINNIVTATDGSNIKLLSSTREHFKLNKNKHYTNATISCIYDVYNNLPLYMSIDKSFNEVDILLKQLNDFNINKYNYKITNITDRGYDCDRLIKYYLKNNIHFVSRITKTNKYVDNLINNKTDTTFTIILDNKKYEMRIIKYTNVDKPTFKETKDELNIKIDTINKKINLIKNTLIDEKKTYKKLCDITKENNKELRLLKIMKTNTKSVNDTLKKNRVLKNISKDKINNNKIEIDKLTNEKNTLKTKINKLINFEHADFYIITNNLKYTFNELKNIYKKRWLQYNYKIIILSARKNIYLNICFFLGVC